MELYIILYFLCTVLCWVLINYAVADAILILIISRQHAIAIWKAELRLSCLAIC